MPNGMKWGDHHRSWIQELCRTFILQSSDHVHQEIDKEVLGGLAYRDFYRCSMYSVCLYVLILRVYMYLQCMNVCMLKLTHG